MGAALVLALGGCAADASSDSLASSLVPLEAEAAPAAPSASTGASQAASFEDSDPQATPTAVSAADLRRMIFQEGDAVVIDVRTDQEYRQGHIPTAILLPFDLIDAQAASAVAPSLDSPVVVYCRSGHRSMQAAQTLAELGYTDVYDFGTIDAWPYGVALGEQDGTAAAAQTTMPNTVAPPSYHRLPHLAEP